MPESKSCEDRRRSCHHRVVGRVDRLRGRPARERVVQDVEIPLDSHRRLRRVVPAGGADRADLALPHPAPIPRTHVTWQPTRRRAAVAALPVAPRRALRQRRLLVDRPHRARAPPTVTSTAPSSGRSPSTGATSRSTPTPTTTRPPSPGSTATRHTGPSSGATTPTGGSQPSTRRRCRRDDDDGGRGVRSDLSVRRLPSTSWRTTARPAARPRAR